MRAEIRWARPDELAELQALYRASSMVWERDRALIEAHPELIEPTLAQVESTQVRVLLDGGDVVAFSTLAFDANAVEIGALFVTPDRMRGGSGRLLVEDAVDLARAARLHEIRVTANPNASGFYRSVGFVGSGTAVTRFGTAERMSLPVP